MDKVERRFSLKTMRKNTKEFLLVLGIGLVLLVVCFRVFGENEAGAQASGALSDKERKVSALLQEIEGVGKANVMICETEEGVASVVVVCEGANNLQVVLDIREAVAAALGMNQAAVKIYLKKT